MKKELKNTRGITLIALVITIIVLLILAGVSIAMLTGDNGIITQANNAKVANEKATAKEKVQVEVGGSRGTDGKLDYSLLKDNLNNIKDIEGVPSQITEDSFPLEVTVDGYKVTITDNGTVAVEGESVEEDDSLNMDEIANDIKNNYSAYLAKAQELGQNTKQDIGIGTDGNVANLELWKYFKTDDGEGMNLGEGVGSEGVKGYVGEIDENGEIIGKVPQYIYVKSEEKLYPIVGLICTFSLCEDLITSPEIPETVKYLESTYWTCSALKNIEIPDNVITVGNKTFENCTQLVSVRMPNVTMLGENAFGGCSGLTSISMQNVSNVGWSAFSNCYSLTNVEMPNLITIGGQAFAFCESLKNIDLPNLTSIEDYAFQQCTNLITVSIPNVTSIKDNAFMFCNNLSSIHFGKSIKDIGYSVFSGCDKLTNVYYEGTEEDWEKISIMGDNSALTNANITYNYKK